MLMVPHIDDRNYHAASGQEMVSGETEAERTEPLGEIGGGVNHWVCQGSEATIGNGGLMEKAINLPLPISLSTYVVI